MLRFEIKPQAGFEVLGGTSRSQAATMALSAGSSTGGPGNRHAKSDQWLYVLSGSGKATIGGREYPLSPGSLVLIERGEAHEICNDGDQPLETISIYAPPAY